MSASTVSYNPTHNMPSHQEDESSYLFNYAKSMYEHTRKQMEAADKSARRRSANAEGTNNHATLRTGHSASTSSDSSSTSDSRYD